MFKKKPTIKTLSPLRSSDRRKVADRIITDFGLESSQNALPDESPDGVAAAQAAHTALRNSILPDNSLSAKFVTIHGPKLTEVVGTVYVGSHGASEQRVLWVKIEDMLYPTVYTLWHNPNLLPLLHTPSFVVEKIRGGADLMTPGLAGPPFPLKANKGALVAVASLENPTVPVVVGKCEIDISALKDARGAKGKAVEIFHWAEDDLWNWSTSGRAGIPAPGSIDGWGSPSAEVETKMQQLNVEDNKDDAGADGGVSLGGFSQKVQNGAGSEKQQLEAADNPEDTEVGEDEMTTDEIDDAFTRAFLYGVHQQMRSHEGQPKYGFNFPLSQSGVMASLVLPFLPAYTEKQTEQLNIKKTSWKNIKKFIKSLDKSKILLAKDMKTEMLVLDIDFNDRQIQNFTPYRLPKRDKGGTNGESKTTGTDSATNEDPSIGQQLKIVNLYKPKDSVSAIFKPHGGKSSGGMLSSTDVKALVVSYLETENLISPTNKRLVNLDPVLSNALFTTTNTLDQEVLAKGSIPREALIERVLSSCAQYHVICHSDEKLDELKSKPKAGAAPKIGIIVETRGGNKTATRVHGFEAFSIPAQPLADELRKSCAGSTSIEAFKGGKGLEVMVQGPQQQAIVKALGRRGVHKNWIDVTDKTKGKKK